MKLLKILIKALIDWRNSDSNVKVIDFTLLNAELSKKERKNLESL